MAGKRKTYEESDASPGGAGQRQIRSDLADLVKKRISELVDRFPSRPEAAGAAEVSLSTIERYCAGAVAPAFLALARLALAARVSLDWYVRGDGVEEAASAGYSGAAGTVEPALLRQALEVVEGGLGSGWAAIPAGTRSDLVATAYQLLSAGGSADAIRRLIAGGRK